MNIQAFREELESTSEKVASAVKSGLLARSALKRKGSPGSASASGDGDGKEAETKAGASAAAKATAKAKGKRPRFSSALEDEFSDSSDDDE